MTEWNDRNLVCSGEPCQTHPVIVHLELVNTVSVRNFEPCNHVSILVLHGHSNERVNSYELHACPCHRMEPSHHPQVPLQ